MIIITCDHLSDCEYIKCDRTKEVYIRGQVTLSFIYTIHVIKCHKNNMANGNGFECARDHLLYRKEYYLTSGAIATIAHARWKTCVKCCDRVDASHISVNMIASRALISFYSIARHI